MKNNYMYKTENKGKSGTKKIILLISFMSGVREACLHSICGEMLF